MVNTSNASLVERFDMLLTPSMKEYIKKNGGAEYLRKLVFNSIRNEIAKGKHITSDEELSNLMLSVYNAEILRK